MGRFQKSMGCDSSRVCGPDEPKSEPTLVDKPNPLDGKAEAKKALAEKAETDQAKAAKAGSTDKDGSTDKGGGTDKGDGTDKGGGTDEVEDPDNSDNSEMTQTSSILGDKEDFVKFNEYLHFERNNALLEMLGPSKYDVVVIGLKNPELQELFDKVFAVKKPFLSKSAQPEKPVDSLENPADADVGQFIVVTTVDGVDMSGKAKVSVMNQIKQKKAEGATVTIEFMGLADNKRVKYTHQFKTNGQVNPLGLNILEVKAQGNELILQSNEEILEKPKDKRRRRASQTNVMTGDKFASERVKSMSPQSSTLTSPQ